MCYDEGILQACIDGELNSEQMREITRHINQCPICRKKIEELRSNDVFVQDRLASLLSVDSTTIVSNKVAKIPVDSEVDETNKKWGMKKLMKFRKIIATAATAAILFTAFSFPAVRSMASEFLTVFRMEKVQTITISTEDLKDFEKALQDGASKVDIDNFGKVEVIDKQESVVPVTMAEASAAVDFDVKLPQPEGYEGPQLEKMTGNSLSLTLDVQKVNSLLQTLGSTKLLPENLNGQTFTMHMPTAIIATYKTATDKIMFAQARSPELKAPSNVDALAIRDALLSVPALPESMRNQLRAVQDWQHTVLIPNIDGTSKDVSVNGSQGVFIDNSSQHGNSNTMKFLVWQQDGVIYTISGTNLDEASALTIAKQMK